MQHYTTHMGNAWTYEKITKYKIKLPHGANTDTNKSNGAKPNQDFENILPKINQTLFQKSPIQDKPRESNGEEFQSFKLQKQYLKRKGVRWPSIQKNRDHIGGGYNGLMVTKPDFLLRFFSLHHLWQTGVLSLSFFFLVLLFFLQRMSVLGFFFFF